MIERAILFLCHAHIDLCVSRVELLRRLNPGLELYVLFGGDEAWPEATQQLPAIVDHLYRFTDEDARWKWRNTDLMVRRWFRDVGRDFRFDILHVIQWDLMILTGVSDAYAAVPRDTVALTALTTVDAIAGHWHWTLDETAKHGWEQLLAFARTHYGYKGPPLACLGPGYALPRTFLADYSAAEVPDYAHDELRLPLFAQLLGYSLVDTGFAGPWFDAIDEQFFNANGVEISPVTVAAEIMRPNGHRVFHPCRRAFTAEILDRWAGCSTHGRAT